MARIPFIGNLSRGNGTQADPPYSGTAPTQPLEQLVGHTAPAQDPAQVRPRAGAIPLGASGRANFYGLPQPDETNPELVGPNGLRRLDEMYRTDAHVRRLVLAAWSPITAGTWALEPYGGEDATDQDRKIADQIWWLLNSYMSPNFTEHLHSVGPLLLRSGFVPFEQLWGTVKHDGQTLLAPRKLDVRLPKTIWRWWQDDYGELTHIGQILPNKPDVVIPTTDVTYYRIGGEGDNWQGTSLLRHAYKHWFIKDRLERIDMVGQERKAVGVPIIYHDPDIDPRTLDELEAAVANLHTSEVAYLMVPGRKMGLPNGNTVTTGKEFLIDVIQFDSSSGEGIQKSLQYHQTAISSSFLTDFLELGHHQVGARATADVQEDPFITAISGALLPPILPPLNALVDRIRCMNWAGADGSPTLKLTLHDDASLSEISAYVQQLAMTDPPAIVVDPDLEDWLRERAGLPPANQQVRAQRQKLDAAQQEAQLAGAQATAQDPQGLEAIKAQAAAKVPPDGDSEPPNPDRPASASAKPGQGKARPASKSQPSKQLDQPDSPIAAGLIVQAADSGRVLLIQRTDDHADDDDTRARWEFPGGKLDDGESDYAAGLREWQEETGATLPAGAKQIGSFVSPDGRYHAFGVRVPREADLKLGAHDPDEVADVRWWNPADLATDHRIRGKVQEALPDITRLLAGKRTLDAPSPPPNYRDASGPSQRGLPTERCGTCLMNNGGLCWGYGNVAIEDEKVCDSWAASANPKTPAAAGSLQPGQIHADIVVDFDGVLHPNTPDDHPLTEGPIAGAVDGLTRLAKRYHVVICTARTTLDPVRAWLAQHGFPALQVTHEKPMGRYYIDDHNWPTPFSGWDEVEAKLLDGDAPMSSGTEGESGLQMVPEVQGDAKQKRRKRKKEEEESDENVDSEDAVDRQDPALRSTLDAGRRAHGSGASSTLLAAPESDNQSERPKGLKAPDAIQVSLDSVAEPTAKWFERLLSQDRLREAFDGARDHIEASVGPAALTAARQMAHQAANRALDHAQPPPELADALTGHYADMYQLGHQTVTDELAKQRHALGKQLDTPADTEAAGAIAGSRLARARQRGEHSARNIANKIGEVLGRAQITGLKDPAALQTAAEQTATAQLRIEALANTAAMVNDGRYDSAMSAGDVIGGVVTSVMDDRSCDPCIEADTGEVLSPDAAIRFGPPNPNCKGGDYCRCVIVWVLSSDPAALSSIM